MGLKRRFPESIAAAGLVGILLGFGCMEARALAADFDFYATELISRESYKKISMDFRDASIKNILKIFSEQSGLNFIASEAVQDRNVTLYLDNVPLKEALDKIMSANRLKYELDPGSNIFVVKASEEPETKTITKIYNLKYARLKGSRLDQAIAAGGAPVGGTAGASGASGASGGASAASGGAAGGAGGSSGGASSTGGLEDVIESVLSEHGKLVVDGRTNSMIITDIQSQFEVIDKVVMLLDTATPEVMIEVEMLEVTKNTLDQMGVDTSSTLMELTGAKRETRFPNFFADGIPGVALPTFTYGTLSSAVFKAVLEFLTTDTKTKYLARPRILTLSNETAEIKITTNEAVSKTTETTASQGATTVTETIARAETGVSLKVTPQVDAHTGAVTMFIQPIVTRTKTSTITLGGQPVKDPEVRSSATTLMVRDGETIVVGGLIRTNDETAIKKMPLLGDIPLVGAMFRHKSSTTEEKELVVFITPHIVKNEDVAFLAKANAGPPVIMPPREQAQTLIRKEEIDSVLERWDN